MQWHKNNVDSIKKNESAKLSRFSSQHISLVNYQTPIAEMLQNDQNTSWFGKLNEKDGRYFWLFTVPEVIEGNPRKSRKFKMEQTLTEGKFHDFITALISLASSNKFHLFFLRIKKLSQ